MRSSNFDFTDQRSLSTLYTKNNIDPQKEAIVLVLDGGYRIPIPRYYDHISLNEALKDIAETLRDQVPQKIYIGNILDGRGYAKNSIHHFELHARSSVDKWESQLSSSTIKNTLVTRALYAAEICNKNTMPLEITNVIMGKYAQLRRCPENMVLAISKMSFSFYKKPVQGYNLSDLLISPFEQLPLEFQKGLAQYYKTFDADLDDAKNGWNDNSLETRVQLLYRVTNPGHYPELTSNQAAKFYNLNNLAWEKASIENRKKILREFASSLSKSVVSLKNQNSL